MTIFIFSQLVLVSILLLQLLLSPPPPPSPLVSPHLPCCCSHKRFLGEGQSQQSLPPFSQPPNMMSIIHYVCAKKILNSIATQLQLLQVPKGMYVTYKLYTPVMTVVFFMYFIHFIQLWRGKSLQLRCSETIRMIFGLFSFIHITRDSLNPCQKAPRQCNINYMLIIHSYSPFQTFMLI